MPDCHHPSAGPRSKSWTLTDTAADLWLDTFAVDSSSLRLPTLHDWSVRKRTLHGGLREGVDLIEVDNGVLAYSLLPSRGMGIWRAHYRGSMLGWRSPVQGPVHPKFVNQQDRGGIGWLEGFDELLCRCGLAWNGPPGLDEAAKTFLTLHGRIANTPAHQVEVRVNLDPPHELSVTGRVAEGYLFGPHLELTSTVTTVPGSNRLVIHDVVENRSATAAEMQLLYHVNVGRPYLEAGSRVVAPVAEMAPLTPRAAEDIDTWDTYRGPTVGYTEQVYIFDLAADSHGKTLAMLFNKSADKGICLRWNKTELPCFTVWKNTAAVEDGYVTGIEPATNYPNFKAFEREQGRVRQLPPGGRWEAIWSLEVYDGREAVAGVLAEIATLQAHVPQKMHRVPRQGWAAG
jgi:hypothetical protein